MRSFAQRPGVFILVIGNEAVSERRDRFVRQKRTVGKRRPGIGGGWRFQRDPCCRSALLPVGPREHARHRRGRFRPLTGWSSACRRSGWSRRWRAEPGQDLSKLTLTIAGDARDTECFTRADLEIDVPQCWQSLVPEGADATQLQTVSRSLRPHAARRWDARRDRPARVQP